MVRFINPQGYSQVKKIVPSPTEFPIPIELLQNPNIASALLMSSNVKSTTVDELRNELFQRAMRRHAIMSNMNYNEPNVDEVSSTSQSQNETKSIDNSASPSYQG